jgi:hypothetical protein
MLEKTFTPYEELTKEKPEHSSIVERTKREDDIVSLEAYGAFCKSLAKKEGYPLNVTLNNLSPVTQKDVFSAWMMQEPVGYSRDTLNYRILSANIDSSDERELAEQALNGLVYLSETAIINATERGIHSDIKRAMQILQQEGSTQESLEYKELERLNAVKTLYELSTP